MQRQAVAGNQVIQAADRRRKVLHRCIRVNGHQIVGRLLSDQCLVLGEILTGSKKNHGGARSERRGPVEHPGDQALQFERDKFLGSPASSGVRIQTDAARRPGQGGLRPPPA